MQDKNMQLSVKEAGELLGMPEKAIYKWIKDGSLPAFRVNEQYRMNRADLLEWAATRNLNVSPAIFEQPESENARPRSALAEAVAKGGIYYGVKGEDRAGVLRAVVDLMPLPEKVDRAFLFQMLMAREALGSTGIGDGIAIPHVRNPIVMQISEPMVTLCFLEKPVDFHAIDEKPVGILFTIVSPTIRSHLHLLSSLAYTLRNTAVSVALRSQQKREEILEAFAGAAVPPAGAQA